MRKVLNSWSVATGLISVRRLTYLPTTRGALLNPRILQTWFQKRMRNEAKGQWRRMQRADAPTAMFTHLSR